MADILNDFRTFLTTDASVLSDLGASKVMIGHEPDMPNECITLYPYGGRAPEPNSPLKYNGSVQVRVRASTWPKSYNTCQTIINKVHHTASVCSNTNGRAYAINSIPIYLTHDDEKRIIHVCNFDIKFVKY